MDISERDKAYIEVNKDFLIAISNLYSTQGKELLHSTVGYSQQAIRGMFFLHGACATAIVATKEIASYKLILIMLAVGALLSVVCSGLSYIAQINFSKHYDIMASNCLYSFHGDLKQLVKPDHDFIKVEMQKKAEDVKIEAENYSKFARWIWILSAFIFALAIYTFALSV